MAVYNYAEMPTKSEVVKEWEERAERHGLASVMRASHSADVTQMAAVSMEDAVMGFVGKHVGSLAGKKVLEIGTGIGRFTRPLAERAAHVTTVDMTAAMIDRARVNLEGVPNIDFVQSEIKDLDFGVDEFDFVFDVWVLMHVLDDGEFVKSLDVMARSAPKAFLCEYTDQGERPVGRFSLLRSPEEYAASFPAPLVAQDEFYYGGDRSSLLLFDRG